MVVTNWGRLDKFLPETEATRTRYELISGDSHVNEPPDLWRDRVPVKYRDRAPRMEEFEMGHGWVLEESEEPVPFGRNACAGLGPFEGDPWMRWEDVRPGGWNPAERLREQDLDGVDAEVLFPTPRVQASVVSNKDADFHLALVRAYNDWLSEAYCAYAPDRLVGLALVPNRGVEQAVAEVERAAQLPGVRGFLLACYPHGDTDMVPEDEPVWAAIEATDMPLCIHVGLNDRPPGAHKATLREGTVRFLDAPGRMEEFIYGGVLKRHPRLELVFAETDAGWVPCWREQADNRWLRNSPLLRQSRGMVEPPSSYLDRISFTYITDRYAIRNRDLIGVEHLMWSSDYPHGGSDYPLSWRAIEGDFLGVPDHEKHLILAGNAERIFKLSR